MKQRVTNNVRLARGILRPLAVERKKAIAASCLVIVMAILWIRVLTNKGPETAGAALIVEQLNVEDTTVQESNVSYIKLPQITGRNDVITRDFFALDNWRRFKEKKQRNQAVIEEVNIVSKKGNEEVVRKVAKKLKLEAIVVLSNKPRAFINNEVLSVGGKMLIREGIDNYECEVIEIEAKKNIVVIKCIEAEAEVKLKLTQTLMVEK